MGEAIIGDNFGTDLPKTEVPEDALVEEKKLARYSRTQEYKRLKEFIEGRIEFYQHYLPNGDMVQGNPKNGDPFSVTSPPDTAHWIAACIVIKEFQNILGSYEQAKQAVANDTRGNSNL